MSSSPSDSYWLAEGRDIAFPTASSCDVDVAIVGGGITGITTAYLLTEAGLRVAVIDMGAIAHGQTARTTAHLTWMIDESPVHLRRRVGEGAAVVLEAHQRAIAEIERLVRRLNIACRFERLSAWRFGLRARDRRQLEHHALAARELGRDAHYVGPDTLRVPSPGGAIHAPDQASFHPLEFVEALAQRIPANGSHVFAHSPVTETRLVDGRWEVHITGHGSLIRARDLVIATNSPTGIVPSLHTRLVPIQTYALAARVAHGTLPRGLYWDCEVPYHYLRVEHGETHDVLIAGGMDHKTGEARDTREAHAALLQYLRETLGIVPDAVTHRWSGQVLEPTDGVAFIGRFPGEETHKWVATGFGGNGMTYGVAAAMLLRDRLLERETDWSHVFEPARIDPLASARRVVRANVNVALRRMGGPLEPAECSSVDQVPRGEGRTVAVRGRKLAVYRDEHGALRALSPLCPHMGCVVDWNSQEKSWDCPCHGSRFHTDGSVFTGPAVSGLTPVALDEHGAHDTARTR